MTKNETVPILTFAVGSQYYALPITDVVEVALMVELVHISGAPAGVLGVADRHGSVLPVVDLRIIFGQKAAPLTSQTLFIVGTYGGQLAGMVVDEVHQVEYIDADRVQPQSAGKYIHGIISLRERLYQIIAIGTLFTAYLTGMVANNDFVKAD